MNDQRPENAPLSSVASPRRRGFRPVPLRLLLPNIVTLIALCLGMTAIRLAMEGSIEWAVSAIAGAAVLDGLDGRIARALKGTSRFGAELDSLADFVDFGVAPAFVLLRRRPPCGQELRLGRGAPLRDGLRACAWRAST